MKIFNMIAIFIYTLLFCIIGAILIALSLRAESLDLIVNFIGYISHSSNLRLGMASIGVLLLVVNIAIAQFFFSRLQGQKIIAFDNPFGRVSVSLSAIEDYIKKLTGRIPEIKEIKTQISAGKSGVEVNTRAVLCSDVNIPEITDKVQNAIRTKLQEMLGLEENIIVKMHVTKIVQKSKKEAKEAVAQAEDTGFKGKINF
ncbi:MAG: alkaline shock response membrane anchor protein AmaP [Candidatus Omnitrophica bacterium]|nr:alkaline shock response membrane anchor protein AmaP [Candidatus Omnitrophota bacterium]